MAFHVDRKALRLKAASSLDLQVIICRGFGELVANIGGLGNKDLKDLKGSDKKGISSFIYR